MIELLFFAGFKVDGDRLKLQQNKIEYVMSRLRQKIQSEQDKLEKAKLAIIAKNKQRLKTKSNVKNKEIKDKILSQHQEQMELAKKGIYNVKATVSDRKGT
eukprot:147156_1